jgi:outer membrane protein assembly factor BamB
MQHAAIVLLTSLGLGLVLNARLAAEDSNWPRFRGPNGTGVANVKGIPTKWTDKEGLLWKAPIPGLGNSSPIVWDDRIFLQSSSDDARERFLLCLEAKTGKTLWTRTSPGKTARTHRKNTLASSTPATDGRRVYVVFWDGEALAMHAYDFDGNVLWKTDLGPFNQIQPTTHGAGNSPIVFQDKVIFANEQDEEASVVALDAKSGRIVWRAPRQGFRTCYSTPFILERNGSNAEVIVASTAGVASLDPHTGKENWSYTWKFVNKPLRTVGSPVYADGVILATSGDGGGDRHAIAVKADGAGDVSKTNLVWENTRALPYVPTVLAHGEHIFAVSDLGVASCYHARTGSLVWSHRLGGNVSASPVLIDGKIYAITEDGDVHVFKAGPQFEALGRSSVGEPVMATPAVAGGRLFVRGKTHLYCIGK